MENQQGQMGGQNAEHAANEKDPFDLIELLYRFLDKWKLILCSALVSTLLVTAYTILWVTPQYKATSTIYVLNFNDSVVNFSDLQLGTELAQDYIKVFDIWEVHEEVIRNLGLSYSYKEMEDMLTVTNISGTRMLDITVYSPYPQEAADIANEYAKVGSNFIADTMATSKPSIMSVARVPASPATPNLAGNVIKGFVLGAGLACVYVLIRLALDDRYKTTEEILYHTGLPTLAVIPQEPDRMKKAAGGTYGKN